jgi:hypothetical protein
MDQHGNTTLATIKGCGHAPALMAADQVKLIVDFLILRMHRLICAWIAARELQPQR